MTLKTYNGIEIPSLMYGTAWKKDSTKRLVELAVRSGFTAIDTANQLKHYDEAKVGEALKVLREEGVKRESLFLQTKFTSLDGQDHRLPYDPSTALTAQVHQSFESSLSHLDTNYLDSYVLHGPHYSQGLGDEDWEVWAAIEKHFEEGKTRIIGVSNVNFEQLHQLCEKAKIKPMVVQNRCYAIRGWDRDVRELCTTHGIIYQGFSLLTANVRILAHPAVTTIAERLSCTLAQVIFRFATKLGMVALTGTTSAQHMEEDLESQRLDLTGDEVRRIETVAML